MKKYTFLLMSFIILVAASCSKTSTTSGTPDPTPPPPSGSDSISYSGTFTNAAHITTGQAQVKGVLGSLNLYLKNFKTDSGPDLYVYLATNTSAGTFINLGTLKSTNGDQVYSISGNPDFTKYKYALIWCQQFGVLFGSAQLMK